VKKGALFISHHPTYAAFWGKRGNKAYSYLHFGGKVLI
jgi:hypothetical protein